jgi:hypothetical protein
MTYVPDGLTLEQAIAIHRRSGFGAQFAVRDKVAETPTTGGRMNDQHNPAEDNLADEDRPENQPPEDREEQVEEGRDEQRERETVALDANRRQLIEDHLTKVRQLMQEEQKTADGDNRHMDRAVEQLTDAQASYSSYSDEVR